ncbi:MAG TPA: hydrogenase maturation nickel metallochaperone HypA [Streptosporangiaceae bacterium]|nr:hydrogenase maturation nickel metallochaperone HypA [Streptosporangiaceae bacterium]
MGTKLVIRTRYAAGPGRAAPYETALCQAIVEAVAPLAHGREITGVRVRVGGHPADPDLVRRCMREATAGTVAEHAAVEFIMDPPVVRCRDCGDETATAYALALLACRRCGSFEIDVTGCGDLTLESITFAS